MGFVIKLYV